ncbi:MAG: hypothetical protein ABGW87_06785 [Sphingomonadaceae bacterium]
MLRSGAPKLLLWRTELLAFYNDAYARLDTAAGTELLGLSFPKMRQETWEKIKDYTLRAQAGENKIHAEKMLFCQSVEGVSSFRFCQLYFTPIACHDRAAYGVLSSYNARRRFRQLGATVQCTEFSTLFSEREQSGFSRTERDSKRTRLWATNWP